MKYGVRQDCGLPRNVDKFYLTPIFGDYDQRCDLFLNQGKMTQYLLETSATAFPPTSCFRSRAKHKREGRNVKKMLESRPEDALVKLVKLVNLVKLVKPWRLY